VKVLLSSSYKFVNDWSKVKKTFEDANWSCVTPKDIDIDMYGEKTDFNEEELTKLKIKFFEHLDNCNILYVYNPNGYIGKSVMAEIGYAKKTDKKIFTIEESNEPIAKMFSDVKKPEELIKEFALKK